MKMPEAVAHIAEMQVQQARVYRQKMEIAAEDPCKVDDTIAV